jgi:hypothetical protein
VSKIAFIIHAHGKTVSKSSQAGVRETLGKLDRVSQRLPKYLQSSERASPMPQSEYFCWILIQRSSLDSLLQACRINLCFSSLPHLLETGEDEFGLQECGRQAATRLIEVQQWAQTNTGKKLWGITASLMAAGMFLLLDLMCFRSSKSVDQLDNQLETIHVAIQMLQDASIARIDGSAILKRLLHLYNIGFASQAVDRQMLLAIMRHASIPVVKPAALDTARNLQSSGSTQHLNRTLNLPNSSVYSSATTHQPLSFPPIDESFNGSLGMDFDYINFDMEHVLPLVDFSEAELGIFDTLPDSQPQ